MEITVKITLFWNVTPRFLLVDSYLHLGVCCLIYLEDRGSAFLQIVSNDLQDLKGVTPQRTIIPIDTPKLNFSNDIASWYGSFLEFNFAAISQRFNVVVRKE
jgi:hypothetical protein